MFILKSSYVPVSTAFVTGKTRSICKTPRGENRLEFLGQRKFHA